jgi:GT2 family glycosyltransferase
MSALPKISIVIPTHNNARLLRECLGALRELRYPRDLLQIVVVDNASRDGTGETLASASRHLPISHIREEKNTGFAPACNRGARDAEGTWVAFLNDDAVAGPGWLEAMIDVAIGGSKQGQERSQVACVAAHIRSRDGSQSEYNGASSNLFGAGRPEPVWGWPDLPSPPTTGSEVFFASGGAMLIHRRTFLDVGGFDPEFFAYFEDVDLGWRLWVLGHRVLYAPDAEVRHIGGSTGKRSPSYQRYTLWECNSLATIIKNYETTNMECILSAGLLLEYKRALMSAGDAVRAEAYNFTAPREENPENIERLPRVSVAHIAAIDRLNRLLPHFMAERRRIQSRRAIPDSQIFPLMGRLWEPQFAGTPYADAARQLFSRLDLYSLVGKAAPLRVLVLADGMSDRAAELASALSHPKGELSVALVTLGSESNVARLPNDVGYSRHSIASGSEELDRLISHADSIVALGSAAELPGLRDTSAPIALVDAPKAAAWLHRAVTFKEADFDGVRRFLRDPHPAHLLPAGS